MRCKVTHIIRDSGTGECMIFIQYGRIILCGKVCDPFFLGGEEEEA